MALTLKPEIWTRSGFPDSGPPERPEDVVKYRVNGFPDGRLVFLDKDLQTTRWRVSRDGVVQNEDYASAEDALAALETEPKAS